jgi:hypothetical protein
MTVRAVIMIIKAISIRQPWAWAIVTGEKDVENRSSHFPQRYRGPVLIHASKGSDPGDWEWMRKKYCRCSELRLQSITNGSARESANSHVPDEAAAPNHPCSCS